MTRNRSRKHKTRPHTYVYLLSVLIVGHRGSTLHAILKDAVPHCITVEHRCQWAEDQVQNFGFLWCPQKRCFRTHVEIKKRWFRSTCVQQKRSAFCVCARRVRRVRLFWSLSAKRKRVRLFAGARDGYEGFAFFFRLKVPNVEGF